MPTEAMLALPLVEFAGSPVAGLDVVDLLNTWKAIRAPRAAAEARGNRKAAGYVTQTDAAESDIG
jgi:hypothetical protein